MLTSTFLCSLLLCSIIPSSTARYILEDDHDPQGILDAFDFFSDRDPTNGFVKYVDRDTAERTGLVRVVGDSLYMGVDYKAITPEGRPSVRITSRKAYNTGLVVLDLSHMPGGICGTWPAFWSFGPDWPNSGEIDIIEGVNDQSGNFMVLHTTAECRITDNGRFDGAIQTPNCDVFALGQYLNEGCRIASADPQTYGPAFNAIGGGVYAMDWTDDAISIYFFPRGRIPQDILNNRPEPGTWGRPLAQFQGGCDVREKFINQNLVFDTTFCGDWAGNTWAVSGCASRAPTCNDYVRDNPRAFRNAYWTINSLKVYREDRLSARDGEDDSDGVSDGVNNGVNNSTINDASANTTEENSFNVLFARQEVVEPQNLTSSGLEELVGEDLASANLTNVSVPVPLRASLDEVIEEENYGLPLFGDGVEVDDGEERKEDDGRNESDENDESEEE